MRGSSFYIDESNIHRKRRVSTTDKPQNGQPLKETPAKLRKFEPAVDINELNLDNWSWRRNKVSILTSITWVFCYGLVPPTLLKVMRSSFDSLHAILNSRNPRIKDI